MASLLFVYGTLRRGQVNHHELQGAPFAGEAATAPVFTLVPHAGFTALRPGGRDAVRGEVFEVTTQDLERLDAFEGPDYVRAEIALADGRRAFAYVLPAVPPEAP